MPDYYVGTAVFIKFSKGDAVGFSCYIDVFIVAVDTFLIILLYLTAPFFVYLAENLSGRPCCVLALYKVGTEMYNGAEFFRSFDTFCKCLDIVIVAEINYLAYKMLFLRIFVYLTEK